MATIQWTNDQRQAISHRGGSLMVSAAAGSGKTAVLVERVLQRVCDQDDPCDVTDFLIVTFTRAAASQMRRKLRSQLGVLVRNDPLNAHLRRQLTLLNQANISTVHGFCSRLIANNYPLLDIPVRFRMADEAQAELMKAELCEQVLDEAYEELGDQDDFLRLCDLFGSTRDDVPLTELMLNLYGRLLSKPDYRGWMEQQLNRFSLGAETKVELTCWGEEVMAYAKGLCSYGCNVVARGLAQTQGDEVLTRKYAAAFHSLQRNLTSVCCALETGSYDAARAAAKGLICDRVGSQRYEFAPGQKEYLTACLDTAKEIQATLGETCFTLDSRQIQADFETLKGPIAVLFLLIGKLDEAYLARKREKNLLDFSDLEHLALQLLERTTGEPTELALRVREQFAEIFVDEYQDTNEVQERIFSAVSRDETNLFFVGDAKQSIYAFRDARPGLFLTRCRAADEGKGRRVALSCNFRSRPQVLETVNRIFEQLMSERLGDLNYGERERLYCGREGERADPFCQTELWLVEKDSNTADGEEGLNAAEREAKVVAQRINMLLSQGTIGDGVGENRKILAGDVVILLRSVKDYAPVYAAALAELGVAVDTDTGSSYFDSTEVTVILSLLRVLDNPHQDLPLIGLLRSPIFSFTESELLFMRNKCKIGDLYTSVEQAAEQGMRKAADFIRKINDWRLLAAERSVDTLLWELYEQTGYLACVRAMRDGERRSANLLGLFEHARVYEQSGYKGLFHFLHFLERLKDNKKEIAPMKQTPQGRDAVRIMSIHQSKGLEFPVCIVAGLGRAFNRADQRGNLLYDPELGVGPQMRDLDRMITYPTFAKTAVSLRRARAGLGEEERILYVAMTRAREKLILCGSLKNVQGTLLQIRAQTGGETPDPSWLMGCQTPLHWLLGALWATDCAPSLCALAAEAESKQSADWIKVELVGQGADSAAAVHNVLAEQEYSEPRSTPAREKETEERINWAARYAWHYPAQELTKLGAKYSVSELKGRLPELTAPPDEPLLKRRRGQPLATPCFAADCALSAAQRGTATHAVMRYLDVGLAVREGEITPQIDKMVEQGFLTRNEADGVDQQEVLRFCNSPIGLRLADARRVWREEPFTFLLDAGQIFELSASLSKEAILVQGIIDCFFEDESGKMVLLDFKTDRTTGISAGELVSRYEMQLALYAYALKECLGISVQQRLLYFFDGGLTLACEKSRFEEE